MTTNVGHESNPIMAWLFSEIGLKASFVISKTFICAIVFYFIKEDWVMVMLDLAYVEIIVNNFKVLK